MPLGLEVKGDPAGIRASAGWLGAAAGTVAETGTQVYRARSSSAQGWQGAAGEGFRGAMTKVGGKTDELSGDLGATRDALHRHADDLDTVRSRMGQARQIASAAGLPVNGDLIAEPGPPPAAPTLPVDRPPTAAEQQTFTAGAQALSAYETKVRAYQDAAAVVTEARAKQAESQGALNNFLTGQVEKSPFTITDVSSGLAGVAIARTSKFRGAAEKYAAEAARYADSAKSSPALARPLYRFLERSAGRSEARMLAQATPTPWSRNLDKLPQNVRGLIPQELGGLARAGKFLDKVPLLRRVPVIGAGITAIGIGTDIAQGKNPVQSAVSGVSSLAAGAAVGAMAGGPVGVVAGAVIGAGVGFVVDEWGDDIARGTGTAADAVGNVGHAVGGAATKLHDWWER